MHVRLVHEFRFEAAHLLPKVPDGHKCRRLHGHSFKVEVAVRAGLRHVLGVGQPGHRVLRREAGDVVGGLHRALDRRAGQVG